MCVDVFVCVVHARGQCVVCVWCVCGMCVGEGYSSAVERVFCV